MPSYGSQTPIGLFPGDIPYSLFAAETPTAPQASQVIARGPSPSRSDQGITFDIEFASSPTDSLQVLGSNVVPKSSFTSGDWNTLYTSSNKQKDSYTDTARFRFYSVYLASQSGGGAVTVIASR